MGTFQALEHGLPVDLFGARFVGVIEEGDDLILFDIAFGGLHDHRFDDDVLLIAIHVKLQNAGNQIVTGGIDTAGIEPLVNLRVVSDFANCMFHVKMRRS